MARISNPLLQECCPQWYANYEVLSSRPNQQAYFVQLNGEHGPAFCSCPAFRYSGDYGEQKCKHIAMVMNNGCLYLHDRSKFLNKVGPNTLAEAGITKISDRNTNRHGPMMGVPCPNCGENMVRA